MSVPINPSVQAATAAIKDVIEAASAGGSHPVDVAIVLMFVILLGSLMMPVLHAGAAALVRFALIVFRELVTLVGQALARLIFAILTGTAIATHEQIIDAIMQLMTALVS